jgi:hypothetical protein
MESSPLHVPLLAGGGARDGEAAAGPREGEVALLAEAYGGDEADALLELDAEPDPEECARDGGAPPWRLLGMGAGGWMVVSWVFYSFFFFGPLNLLLFYEAVDAPLTRASLEPLEALPALFAFAFGVPYAIAILRVVGNRSLWSQLVGRVSLRLVAAIAAGALILVPTGLLPCILRHMDGGSCGGATVASRYIVATNAMSVFYFFVYVSVTVGVAVLPVAAARAYLLRVRDALRSGRAPPRLWRENLVRIIRWMQSPSKLAGLVLFPFLVGAFLSQALLIAVLATSVVDRRANRGVVAEFALFSCFLAVFAILAFARVLGISSALNEIISELEFHAIAAAAAAAAAGDARPRLSGPRAGAAEPPPVIWSGFRDTKFHIWVFPVTVSVLYTGLGLLLSVATTALARRAA